MKIAEKRDVWHALRKLMSSSGVLQAEKKDRERKTCCEKISPLKYDLLPQPLRTGDHELRAGVRLRDRGAFARGVAGRRAEHPGARAPAAGLRGQVTSFLQET